MLRRLAPPVVVLACLLALSACGSGSGTGGGGTSVVAAFYPLAWAAEEVVGDDGTVTDLTTPGVEPHDLELTPRQTARLSAADLVVYEKDFQPSVDAAVEQDARASLDVSASVDLHRTSEGPDPHFWQDPKRMAAYVEALAAKLGSVDPDHRAAYERRAKALVTELTSLDAAYAKGLASCKVSTIVVSHDAFNYLGKYGVEVAGIAGLSPDAEPSAKHLRQLQTLIRSDGVTTVFGETLASPKLAHALSRDLGLRSEVLDPIEGVTKDAPTGTDYLTLMRSNLTKLERANSCT